MIAKLTFQYQGEPLTAIMGDNGKWRCSDSLVEKYLNTAFVGEGSVVGGFGSDALQRAADTLHGQVEYDPRRHRESVPGRVY